MKLLDCCKLHRRRRQWTLMVYAGHIHALEVNESFAHLWQAFDGKEFTRSDVAAFLEGEYGLDEAEAREQAAQICDLWETQHLLMP
ncbi:MAG: PqqD family protein [Bacteroidales bacterium]|nr:PqqD family protein [Bacteroidales bacterium]